MNFRYIITQNSKEIAGFHDFLNACNYKDMIQSINRTAGYKDRFQIVDTQAEK